MIDNEYALKLKELDIQAKLAVAEIETKARNLSERLAFVEEFIKHQHAQAHDAGMQAQDHAHERALAQQQQAAMAEMQGQFQLLLLEKQGKVIDNEYALKLEDMKIQAQLAVAEISTKAQNVSERLAFVEEFIKQQHAQAHDAGMQAQDHAHERGLAQQQAEAQSKQSAQDAAQGGLDGSSLPPEHVQALSQMIQQPQE